ncbi:MAG: MurR/RpiR family transcriptional regulator [Candidatus Limiplasma sp.]|nr:MurR/RpiR family transcriptional regulator [Candidatus Limiplasma sp.]
MENSPLLIKLQALRPAMTASERKITETILAAPREVIHLSITGIAERAGVSDATVVRLCKRLGMQGYQELKLTMAQELVSSTDRIYEDVRESDTNEEILGKVFESTKQALDYTARVVDRDQFEKAVQALAQAGKVFIYGCGNSAAVALDLQHKLMRLSINAMAYMDAHMQCISSVQLRQGDVCVAVSHSGSSRAIVAAAQLAKDKGATVICMTGVGSSPLSKISDCRLDAASREVEYHIVALSSRISQYTLIDSLYTALAIRQKARNAMPMEDEVERALKSTKY